MIAARTGAVGLHLSPGLSVPFPRIVHESRCATHDLPAAEEDDALAGRVVRGSVSCSRGRTDVFDLSPLDSIEHPRVAECIACCRLTSEDDRISPRGIECHRVAEARRWPEASDLCPVTAVPSPRVPINRPVALRRGCSTEQVRQPADRVVRDTAVCAWRRADVLPLRPKKARHHPPFDRQSMPAPKLALLIAVPAHARSRRVSTLHG